MPSANATINRIRLAQKYNCMDYRVLNIQPPFWIENLLNYESAFNSYNNINNGK